MAKDVNYKNVVKGPKHVNFTISTKDSADKKSTVITIGGIAPSDADAVLDRLLLPKTENNPFRKPIPSKNIQKVKYDNGILSVAVANDKIDDFMATGLKGITSGLDKTGHYTPDCVSQIVDKIDFAFHKPGNEELKKAGAAAYENMADMWMTYLNNLGNPLFVEAYNIYAKIYANRQWGHMLSFRNILMIQNAAKKDGRHPTLVLGHTVWNKYGRGIKRGAKPYYLERLQTDRNAYSRAEYNQAKDACGFPDMDIKELSFTVDHLINVTAENIAYGKTHTRNEYSPYWGYDISDTYPFNFSEENSEDFLNARPGATSNIAHAINQLAQEVEDREGKKREELPDEYNASEMEEHTRIAADFISQVCKDNKLTVAPSNNPTSTLINGLKAYYKKLVPKAANIIKENNIESYVNDAVHMTLIMLNIGMDGVNQFQHGLTYTQKEAAALGPVIIKVISALGKVIYPGSGGQQAQAGQPANAASAPINEDMGNNAVDMFIRGIEMIGGKVIDDKEESAMNLSESVRNFLESYNKTLNILNGGYLNAE